MGTPTGTTTQGQSKEYFKLQDWGLTMRYSLMSYLGYFIIVFDNDLTKLQ